jgi:hypothetical protein
MTESYPVPPPELVEQWIRERDGLEHLATQSAQWGADKELEACCQALRVRGTRMRCMEANQTIEHLRATRRPKPPSLKEQALLVIDTAVNDYRMSPDAASIIRRALEALDD